MNRCGLLHAMLARVCVGAPQLAELRDALASVDVLREEATKVESGREGSKEVLMRLLPTLSPTTFCGIFSGGTPRPLPLRSCGFINDETNSTVHLSCTLVNTHRYYATLETLEKHFSFVPSKVLTSCS